MKKQSMAPVKALGIIAIITAVLGVVMIRVYEEMLVAQAGVDAQERQGIFDEAISAIK